MRKLYFLKIVLTVIIVLSTISVFSQSYFVGHKQITFVDSSRSNRQIQTEVYYPATTAGDNTPFATGQFPLIVFGHGFVMTWDSYSWLWDSLVVKGYILAFPRTEGSMSPSHSSFGLDLRFLNDYIKSQNTISSSFFFGKLNMKSSIMGHSMGGGSSFLAASNNTNLTTLINFAAAETNPSAIAAAANVSVPALVIYGVNDGVCPPAEDQIPMYNALSSSCKTLVGIIGGGHCYFANYNFNCNFGEGTTSPQPTITREQQHTITSQVLFPYLDYMLKDIASSELLFIQRLHSLTGITHQRNCPYDYDIELISLVSPTNKTCYSNEPISIKIKNIGTQTIDFSINPISLNASISGTYTHSYLKSINNGNINPNDTLIITFSDSLNMSNAGTYNISINADLGVDEFPLNNSINNNTFTSKNPTLYLTGNNEICIGETTILSSTANCIGTVSATKSNSTTISIPDNNTTGILSEITFTNLNSSILANQVKSIVIDSLIHPYVGDLELSLIAPDNSAIILSNKRGGSGDNYKRTVFTMSASTSITNGTAPFTGSYLPEQSFSMLTGSANGIWKLKIRDLGSGDLGKIHKWTINFEMNNQIVSYVWNTASNDSIINVSPFENTIYSLTVTDAIGCEKTESFSVIVNQLPIINLGTDTTICNTENITLNAGNNMNYLWSDNSTNQSLFIDGNLLTDGTHTYFVEVTDNNNCSNSDTINITINTCTYLNNTNDNFINVYPNPFADNIYIDCENLNNFYVEIYNIEQKPIIKKLITDKKTKINLNELKSGLYTIKIVTDTIQISKVMVKIKYPSL